MNQPVPNRPAARPDTPPASYPQEEADARDFAEFIAGQDPLDAAAAGWVVRRQDGLTPEEEAELQEWLAADPAHARALAQVEDVWSRMDELPDEGVVALKAGLPSHKAGTALPPSVAVPAPVPVAPEPQHHPRPSSSIQPASPGRRSWLIGLGRFVPQITAAAVAFSVVSVGWYGWSTWQHQPTFQQSFATARGEQKKVNLPDGSTLWLDTTTQAEVALYRQRREVRLTDGQALFAVQSNPDQPFDVLTGGTRITVVGTRFSVRRTRSGLGAEGSVSVVVEEGRVRVASRSAAHKMDSSSSVELSAGQSIIADAAGALGPVNRDDAPAATWREGRVSFSGTPLMQALAEFERYGDTGLVIRDPAVAALKVNGSFDLRQIGAFARALPRVLPVQLSTRDGQTEIIAAPGG
ncbi:FecR domain-containing protein [Nitrosomonas europaea]|uniref:FecR family protein n=1 Tax=Nitrosomonas europaea TaxID=915 RepID=UPI0032649B18